MGDVVSFADAAKARDSDRVSVIPDEVLDFVGVLQANHDLDRGYAVACILACLFGDLSRAAEAGFEEAQEVLDYFRGEFWDSEEDDA